MMVNPLPVEKIEMFDEEDVGTTTTSKKLPVAYTSSTEASPNESFRNYPSYLEDLVLSLGVCSLRCCAASDAGCALRGHMRFAYSDGHSRNCNFWARSGCYCALARVVGGNLDQKYVDDDADQS